MKINSELYLFSIEVGQPSLAKSAARKERELKKLFCSIKYDKGGSVYRSKDKERAVISPP